MAKRRKLVRDESTPEKRQWWDAVKAAAAQAPRLVVDGGAQRMAPTDQAMRAARALFALEPGHPEYEEWLRHRAETIDREAGLPELLYEQIEAWREVETLRARLAAVEALHFNIGGLCGYCSNGAVGTVEGWPCPTLRAARGEHE